MWLWCGEEWEERRGGEVWVVVEEVGGGERGHNNVLGQSKQGRDSQRSK